MILPWEFLCLVFSRLGAQSASVCRNHSVTRLETQVGFLSLSTVDVVAWRGLCCRGLSGASWGT